MFEKASNGMRTLGRKTGGKAEVQTAQQMVDTASAKTSTQNKKPSFFGVQLVQFG